MAELNQMRSFCAQHVRNSDAIEREKLGRVATSCGLAETALQPKINPSAAPTSKALPTNPAAKLRAKKTAVSRSPMVAP